ncbi:hypothetical protein NQ317_011905 [Molorchus minor]|uniref:Uncharacterized protein n=1 Tax=Molorchus minor TaxID=1323400 RepID=A0ABQ9IWE3_9CUCU|nr:hypothetical protein NQ317_011905 [Molorchus minor]
MAKRLAGDLRALILVYNSPEAVAPPLLQGTLKQLQTKVNWKLMFWEFLVMNQAVETSKIIKKLNIQLK